MVVQCIAERRSFLVETVLSSPKYRDGVEVAVAAGFRFGLIYVSVHPPELSVLRVATRVAKGGHDVHPATVLDRHRRSHEQLSWFAPRADIFRVYDNSGSDIGGPAVIASRIGGGPLTCFRPGLNPAVDEALRQAGFPSIVVAPPSTPPPWARG